MLIPTVLALSSFFAENFPHISWYPYWYLGNPYHYLIGPVVPIALAVVQSSKFKVQSYDLYLGFILLSFVVGGIGIYFLLRDWRVGKLQAIASGVLYTVLPAGFFLLNYQNGLNHIAFGFLPFALLLFKEFLVKENKFLIVFLTLTITIMLLTSLSIILPLIIGILALFVSGEDRHSGEEERRLQNLSRFPHGVKRFWTSQNDGIEEKIGKTILIVLLSLSLSTLWYTARFWFVIIANPSLGGVPLGKLLWSIFQFLLQFLPLFLAIAVVRLKRYKFQGHLLFGLLFFASFLFLSLVRFVSDPDFVMDWVSFGLEMQMGGAILGGNLVLKAWKKSVSKFLILGGIIIVLLFDCYIVRDLFVQQFNNLAMKQSSNNYKNRVLSMLKENIKEQERVFLSGSSVFFINSKLNIQQVRGGVDQSSIHPFWLHGVYQIREGEDPKLASDWLKILGASYILVHDRNSREPFHDFKHAEKFLSPSGFVILACPESPSDSIRTKRDSGVAPPVGGTPQNDGCEDSGDMLYKVNNASIGRIADSSILNVQKPINGADKQAINNYILSFKRPLAVNYQKPNEIAIEGNIKQGEIISLAISYDPYWRIETGEGIIDTDSLGNMVIIPKNTGSQRFTIVYKRNVWDMAIPLGLSIAIAILLIKYQKIAPYVRKRFSKLHVGLGEEEY